MKSIGLFLLACMLCTYPIILLAQSGTVAQPAHTDIFNDLVVDVASLTDRRIDLLVSQIPACTTSTLLVDNRRWVVAYEKRGGRGTYHVSAIGRLYISTNDITEARQFISYCLWLSMKWRKVDLSLDGLLE